MSDPSVRVVRRAPARSRVFLLLAGVLALVAAACAPAPPTPPLATGYNPDDAPQAGVAAYTGDGPHKVGVTTLSLSDRKVEVWYPADNASIGSTPKDAYYIRSFVPPSFDPFIPPDINPPYVTNAYRDVPAATDGPYPLALFSHGAAGYRLTSTELTTHLASWGFVVIAPDYLERGLTSALGSPPASPRPDTVIADEAINLIKGANLAPGPLNGIVNSTKVYPFGHSAGGGTSLRLLDRPDVDAVIPMASGVSLASIQGAYNIGLPPGKSIMWLGGRNDGIASIANVRTGYDYTAGQKKIIEFGGTGHNNAFTEICEIGGGGAVALAVAAGLPVPDFLLNLGADGCSSPPFTDSPVMWPQVNHLITAELRYRSGLDPLPVGLGTQVTAALPNVLDYRHAP